MGAILDRVSEEQIEQAKAADILALAERHAELRRKTSAGEYEGPCPRCGGSKRFVVHERDRWWFCRDCHPKRSDTIGLLRWLQPGLGFAEAVAQLAGGAVSTSAATVRKPAHRQKPAQPAEWQERSERIVTEAYERLWAAEGEPGQAYLEGRGLEPHTWLQYRLGFRPDAPLPGTEGKQRAPAIAIPWYAGGRLVAVRYRFLQVHHYMDADGKERAEKQTAEYQSDFTGKLFGSQALPEFVTLPVPAGHRPGEQQRALLICEGEINAMSCWQAAGETLLDVLSLGSEGQALSPAARTFAQRYGQVLVWADKEQVAQRLMAALPGAVGIRSPGGKDANDLLKIGLLGGFLATMRANHAKSLGELEALLWALYDAALLPAGIDTGSAKIAQRLAAQLGKQAALCEAGPGTWIAERALYA